MPDTTPTLPQDTRARSLKTPRTIMALILREMATTYGRSPGGYVWAIAEPAAALALLSIVFSLVLRSPSLGSNFPLFYATGYLPFTLYSDAAQKTARALRYSRPLLAYPGVRFTDTLFARLILTMLTHALVFYIIIAGIHAIFEVDLILNLPAIVGAFALAGLLGFGIGSLNCYLFSIFPIWEQIWTILNRPMFILSGIFFIYEDVPRSFQGIMWWNPVLHITGLMRQGFFATYDTRYISVPYVLGVAAVTLFFGILLLRKHWREIIAR